MRVGLTYDKGPRGEQKVFSLGPFSPLVLLHREQRRLRTPVAAPDVQLAVAPVPAAPSVPPVPHGGPVPAVGHHGAVDCAAAPVDVMRDVGGVGAVEVAR